MIAHWWRRLRTRDAAADAAVPVLAREALRLLTLPPAESPRIAAAPKPSGCTPPPGLSGLSQEEIAALRVMLRARELLRARSGLTPPPATLDAIPPAAS